MSFTPETGRRFAMENAGRKVMLVGDHVRNGAMGHISGYEIRSGCVIVSFDDKEYKPLRTGELYVIFNSPDCHGYFAYDASQIMFLDIHVPCTRRLNVTQGLEALDRVELEVRRANQTP